MEHEKKRKKIELDTKTRVIFFWHFRLLGIDFSSFFNKRLPDNYYFFFKFLLYRSELPPLAVITPHDPEPSYWTRPGPSWTQLQRLVSLAAAALHVVHTKVGYLGINSKVIWSATSAWTYKEGHFLAPIRALVIMCVPRAKFHFLILVS